MLVQIIDLDMTPLPVFIGMVICGKTRKCTLIDCLAKQGVCITNQRVSQILNNITATCCKNFNTNGIVCPSPLQSGVFTMVAIDNLNRNSSSNTSQDSFNGTTITVFQQSTDQHLGNDNKIQFTPKKEDIDNLPTPQLSSAYTNIFPTPAAKPEAPVIKAAFKSLTHYSLQILDTS